jgi:hypothetical protein
MTSLVIGLAVGLVLGVVGTAAATRPLAVTLSAYCLLSNVKR